MKNHLREDAFYRFIESADKLPAESHIFPHFQFMDQSIRKHFHQLKKTSKVFKNIGCFEDLLAELESQAKVELYVQWARLLDRALELAETPAKEPKDQLPVLEDDIYIRKKTSTGLGLFHRWEKKKSKLTGTTFTLMSNKSRVHELRNYAIRKSKSKQMFSFVLVPVLSHGKVLHCGFSTQCSFDSWFACLSSNIKNQRISFFLQGILEHRSKSKSKIKNQGQIDDVKSVPTIFRIPCKQQGQEGEGEGEQQKQHSFSNELMVTTLNRFECEKTQTEVMIENQMKSIDLDDFMDGEGGKKVEYIEEVECIEEVENREERTGGIEEEIEQNSEKPNIFRRLVGEEPNLLNFVRTPAERQPIHCDSQCCIYEMGSVEEQDVVALKFFMTVPHPKSVVFQFLGSSLMRWNQDVDVWNIKTKISSENTALYYEKNRPMGILYRERDFLYLRHVFSIAEYKNKHTFIIDKSIDSIHHPPFMSVVRAEKQLIWGLIEKQSTSAQSMLIVEGWIKGGGFLNQLQNKQMTLRFMKGLTSIKGPLKHMAEFGGYSQDSLIFKEHWQVSFSSQANPSHRTPHKQSSEEDASIGSGSEQNGEAEGGPRQVPVKVELMKEEQEMLEFMKRTSEENQEEQSLGKSEVMASEEQISQPGPPSVSFNSQNWVIIPQEYLKKRDEGSPREKEKKGRYYGDWRGHHHLWKGEWEVLGTGGLAYIDEEKTKEQKKVLTYIIKRIGSNIFSGKGILNISLPVDIFCLQSNIERIAMSFGYFPHYLELAAQQQEAQHQFKYVIASGVSSSLIYLTMQKPFNPILGETFQCLIDGCPVYFEQISHHPPVAAFFMKGRGYTVSGSVEAKMDLSINSGTGINEGIVTVQFDNGSTIYYTTPAGCLAGLTYGDRRLHLVGKSYYWSDTGFFLEMSYGAKNKGFFGGKAEGEEKLTDYIEGTLKQYRPQSLKEIAFRKDDSGRLRPIVPKGSPNCQAIKVAYKVHGRWDQHVFIGAEKIFDVNESRYYGVSDEKNPLPSHCNFREDIVYRRLRNFVLSQHFKECLEVRQREDQRLRNRASSNPNNNNSNHRY